MPPATLDISLGLTLLCLGAVATVAPTRIASLRALLFPARHRNPDAPSLSSDAALVKALGVTVASVGGAFALLALTVGQ
ncbi:hypothetical protein [Haloprofundus salinisoli]|uniref:hypothetical protein n=1 Tax=Haloprofundus salinisoli TaxID=2876193 RepID=UPI001CCE9939|nr:hypothetical protein [Haloprofundus salinisoli]